MSFETIPEPEKEKIGTFEEALAFLLREGEPGARMAAFQDFVAGEEEKVGTPVQTLELAFRMAELYYNSGFKAYALECFRELEEAGDYEGREADLSDRAREFADRIEAEADEA